MRVRVSLYLRLVPLLMSFAMTSCGMEEAPEPQRKISRAEAPIRQEGSPATSPQGGASIDPQSPQTGPIASDPQSEKEMASPGAPSTPAPPAPAPTKMPIRTVANANEKTAMQALYASPANQGGCTSCHGALATSEKRGRTAAQIQQSQTILQHRNVAAAMKWPRDLADTTDDGTDTAQLFASAMAEILK